MRFKTGRSTGRRIGFGRAGREATRNGYITRIRKAADSNWSLDIPKVPGCAAAGMDLNEAVAGHHQLMAEENEARRKPRRLEAVADDPENRDAVALLLSTPLAGPDARHEFNDRTAS